METKIKEYFSNFTKMKHKEKLLVFACIFGVVLILLSEVVPSGISAKKSESTDYRQYITSLEEKTENIISSIDGVGKCKVMITLQETDENFYAQNTDENTDSGSISKRANMYCMRITKRFSCSHQTVVSKGYGRCGCLSGR
ncbi:MAG: hypothetical protein ACLS27_05805 [Eubacterium sp.]